MSPIPDYLTEQNEDTIRERMFGTLPSNLDATEGSFLWDSLMPPSIELALAAERMRLVLEWGFASTSFGEFLDLRAEEHGLMRRAAVAASGALTFTGANGTVIPAGTEVSTPSTESVPAQVFVTDAEVTIAGGSEDVAATAVTGGAAGNVGVGQLTLMESPIAGVTGVTNAAPMTGGLDEETDEDLLVRYFQRVRNPGSSGNVADYIRWALERPGVGGVAVIPLEDGPGTVTVALIGTDKLPASAPIVTDVQEYIAPGGANTGTGEAPIGATVTVEAADDVVIDVEATLTIEAGYVEADVETAAEAALVAYFAEIAFADDNDVRHARVVTALLDVEGVVDAQSVTINAGTGNIVIGAKQVAVLGTVTWN